jgi:hypothetical protein
MQAVRRGQPTGLDLLPPLWTTAEGRDRRGTVPVAQTVCSKRRVLALAEMKQLLRTALIIQIVARLAETVGFAPQDLMKGKKWDLRPQSPATR